MTTLVCTSAPNICGASLWKLLHATLLAPRIVRWLIDIWNIYTPLSSGLRIGVFVAVNMNLTVLKTEHRVSWSVDTHVPYMWCFNPLNISMQFVLKWAATLNFQISPVLLTTKLRNYVPLID